MSNNNESDNDSKSYKLRRIREFKAQESLLTTYFESSKDFQTLYAGLMSFVHVYLFIQVLVYCSDVVKFREDMQFLHWSFVETFPPFVTAWIQLSLMTALFHPIVLIWKNGFLPSFLLLLMLAGYITLTTMVTLGAHLSPTLTAAIACEHIRMMMKVVAFTIAQKNKKLDVDGQENTSFLHYIYFLFAPTVVFRESYPRTERINWRRIASLLYHFILHVYFVFLVVRHWIAPFYRDVGIKPLVLKDVISFQASVYAMTYMFHYAGIGCALIHCWMNIWAELLMFADRNFYQDWWAAVNQADQLRKWNSVVGDWIYEYAYAGIVYVTAGNKSLSTVLVYIMSAVMHDYVMNMMLGLRFLPIMTFMYGGLGSVGLLTLFVYRKLKLNKVFKEYIVGNAAIHVATGFSWICWINMYAIEFYCRQNVPRNETSLLDAFAPQFPYCVQFESIDQSRLMNHE